MSNKNEIRTIKQQIEIVDSFLKGIKDTNVDHMMNGCMFDLTNKDMRDRLYSQDLNKLKESMDKLLKSISLEEQLMEINGKLQDFCEIDELPYDYNYDNGIFGFQHKLVTEIFNITEEDRV